MKKMILAPLAFLFLFTIHAQTIGTKVSFKGTDGKNYTGTIKEIKGDQYKIKYDGFEYEAWAQRSQFSLANENAGNTIAIGTKVSFTGTDGKTYSGVVKEIQDGKYKVKYDGYDYEAWMLSNQFSVTNATATATNAVNTNKNGDWKVGDKVDVQDMYANNQWEAATITMVHDDWNPKRYKASLDNPAGHAITDLLLNSNQIRSRNAKPTKFAVGARVDAYYASADAPPRGRATVIEDKGNGRYKVKYDGCAAYWDEEVDWSQLKPATVIASTNPEITALFGKWAMFVYSYPTTVIHDNNIYRQYGTGAKAPPLQINADGSYTWYDEYNKPPVKGKWTTHAKIEGLTMGTEAVNGIILTDSHGVTWKIHQDRADHIEARKMCSGETEGGTKIK